MLFRAITQKPVFALGTALLMAPSVAQAALDIPLTVTLSESVTVTGTPQIAVDIGGVTRYATYTAGTGTNTLTFTLTPQLGDLDLDGITVASPINLNGGTLKDAAGNNATLTFTPPNTSGIKVNYPSLGMDFTYDADGRYTLNGTAYNDLASLLSAAGGTFTRPSIGTYFDSTGTLQTATSDVPRFDHDPITHARKGILLEEGRTNLLQRSSQFDNAYWGKSNASIAQDVATAPDNGLFADKLVEGATNSKHEVYNLTTIPVISGTSYTFSIFAKAGERNNLHVEFSSALFGGNTTNYNLQSGTITSGPGSIISIGSGYYRCQKTLTATASGNATIYLSTGNGTSNIYLGDGSSGLYIWGAQYEQGTYPTSYIPTTTATVTRAADSLVIPTGAWYNQSSGSFYTSLSWESATSSGYPMFIRADDMTSNNRWNLYLTQSSGALGVDTTTSGSTQAYWSMANTVTGSARIATAQASNNANAAFNGVIQAIDTSYTPPSVTRFFLPIGTANKWYKSVKYYPARVADAQLALVTQ